MSIDWPGVGLGDCLLGVEASEQDLVAIVRDRSSHFLLPRCLLG